MRILQSAAVQQRRRHTLSSYGTTHRHTHAQHMRARAPRVRTLPAPSRLQRRLTRRAPRRRCAGGPGTRDWLWTLVKSAIPRIGINANLEINNSSSVQNFVQMRRRAVFTCFLFSAHLKPSRGREGTFFLQYIPRVEHIDIKCYF